MTTTNHTSPSGEDAANGATSDTGNAEADRIINRLSSSDPEFDDCIDAVAFIRKLVAEHKGPEGFATWNDAAVWERQRRLAAEKSLRDTSKELICAVAEQSVDQVDDNGAIGEREAHCVNTCNFYNKNRPCECPAPQSDATSWEALFDRVALELNCLPSSSVDGNEHVFHAIEKLRAAQPVEQTEKSAATARNIELIEGLVKHFEVGGSTLIGEGMSARYAEAIRALLAREVPSNVMAALDRMCTPLDESVLKGATADADAHSMKLIRDYVLSTPPAQSCGDAEQADEALRTIHGLLHTQDNRITAAPMFAVQQKRRVYGIDTEYEPLIAWTNDEGFEASPEDAARFETAYDHDCDAEQEGYRRIGYHEYWEFVTGCFTEQGCKDYLARNGHNLNEPRIYAYGTYRNEEWKTIRDFLMSDRFSADAARTKDSK
jgi:hypothetical protein